MKFAICSIIILIMIINFSDAQNYNLEELANNTLGEWINYINPECVQVDNLSDIGRLKIDSDLDRIPDVVENCIGTDINKTDTDGDGIDDYKEIREMPYQTDPSNNDTDGDGLSDLREYWWLCDPTNAHSAGLWETDGELLQEKRTPFLHGSLNEDTDQDNDGLPDYAEMNEIGTDPKNPSTDGDQFSDGDEYFGLNMPSRIGPEDHYFVAAYPEISIKLVRIVVTPISTITFNNGNTIRREWSISEETKDSRDIEVNPEAKLQLSPAKLFEGTPLDALNIDLGFSANWKDTYSVARNNSTSGLDEAAWNTAVTTAPDRAARLTFILEIANVGSLPANDISFDMNLLLNDRLIKTVSVGGAQNRLSLDAGDATEYAVDDESDGEEICISLDYLEKIDSGASLKIKPFNIKFSQLDDTTTPYNMYISNIERCTSTLIFDFGDKYYREYKVYSGLPTKPMTYGEAINLTIKKESDIPEENGSLDILYSENAKKSIVGLLRSNRSIMDLEIKPTWILLLRPHNDTAPEISNIQFNSDLKEVSFSAKADDGIDSVYIKKNISNGARKKIKGICISGDVYSINLSNLSDKDLIATGGEMTIFARDSDGDITPCLCHIPISNQISKIVLPEWGYYYDLTYFGHSFFNGYSDGFLKETSLENVTWNRQVSRVLLNSTQEISPVASGNFINMEEGYALRIKSIDTYRNKVYLELEKDGSVVDSKVISPKDDATLSNKTYYYKKDVGPCKDVVIIAVHFGNVFPGYSNRNLAKIDAIWQISETPINISS